MILKVTAAERKATSAVGGVRAACTTIAKNLLASVAAALRAEVQQRGILVDALFRELLAPGEDTISEAAFMEKLRGLPDLTISEPQAKLICNHIDGGRVG